MLTATHTLAARLSQEEITRAIRDNWSSRTDGVWLLAGFGVLLAAVLVVIYLRRPREVRGAASDATGVFNSAADLLNIASHDRRLLTRIAAHQSLPNPLTLLLSPRTLRVHAANFCADLPRPRRGSVLKRVRALRRVIRA